MFSKHATYMDFSTELRDPDDWKVGKLRSFDYPLNITAFAIEPISCIFAIGTSNGAIHILGSPGVEVRLALPEPVGVKFLQFATLTFQLVCLDQNSVLHIWDLSSYGRPKYMTSVKFDRTNFLTLSPSHTHAFLALNSGEIKTYDLTCMRKSFYTLPNMWKLYEQEQLSGGLPDIWSPESRVPVEIVIHPRNLNLLFVAYAGGVVLSDLTQRKAVRVYEFILPPGTPGGLGYGANDILTTRRPPVTAMAIHPAGHFFVVGHADGSLSFWAVEDPDQPLLVRTLDILDVNVVDTEKLDEHLFQEREKNPRDPLHDREPIFKTSWSAYTNSSDPRSGETTLAILGGLQTGGTPGLSVLSFPAFNPSESPIASAPDSRTLSPFLRTEMRKSVNSMKIYFYHTRGVVQDYLLAPWQSPHFSGTFDPIAILMLTDSRGDTRTLEAYQFPPPEFSPPHASKTTTSEVSKSDGDPLDVLTNKLATTLKVLQASDEPEQLRLPTMLVNGHSGLVHGQLLKMERDIYDQLVNVKLDDENDLELPLKGGVAWADDTQTNDLKLSKYQPNRILVTHYLDLTVRFYDISAQLLLGSHPMPVQTSFPNPLVDLTIDVTPLIVEPSVSKWTSPSFFEQACIDFVQVATESLETAVVFKTGEVALYRLSGSNDAAYYREAADEDLIILEHVSKYRNARFSPYFMLSPRRGAVETCALSDIGFLAISYSDGTLFVVDMRAPQVILRDSPNRKKRNSGIHFSRSESADPVMSMIWCVSPLNKDPQSCIRLVTLRASGLCHIYTVMRGSGVTPWICEGPIVSEGIASPLSQGSFILDSKSGEKWKATRSRLAALAYPAKPGASHGILVTCGAKGARCYAYLNGERVSKVEWGSKFGIAQTVEILEKLGSRVLIVFNDRHEVYVYSLPHLEHLHIFQLPQIPSISLSVDETGDYITWTQHPTSGTVHQATYCTLFDIRRAYNPSLIELTKPAAPAQPQPVSVGPTSLLGSWFTFNQTLTGEQVDTLLGGPDRPIPESEPRVRGGYTTANELAAGVSGVAAATAATQGNLYNRLTSALNERGQILGDLEDRFNALEEGSKNMVTQAKRLATQQTARSWFGL
ncbi:lethal giant larvae like, C-terminal-domain-containing protein [Collybia nuda]|uniref:Lethal giant larvae like, C-terminal-domain-containing protein n=1 Tax=Collybia nuda TaxID=64659 RepID=A0A9P6CQ28_9AGAR|nr:lethal giant larvae like, C-terminal-domain-containing protein [Collybia nuda]